MTRQRNDNHSTEFGLWLRNKGFQYSEGETIEPIGKVRKIDLLDSRRGFVATNLDYIWSNYKTGQWMYIEEKRYMSRPTRAQRKLFIKLHEATKCEKYQGFHLIQFEKTNPEDGDIYLNEKKITKKKFLEFLMFRCPNVKSWINPKEKKSPEEMEKNSQKIKATLKKLSLQAHEDVV